MYNKTSPLSYAQQEIMQACMIRPSATCYNLPAEIVFDVNTDVKRLCRALEAITLVREKLHTRFIKDTDGEVRQYIDPEMEIAVTLKTMSEEDARRYIHNDFVRPFPLFDGSPLCRFEVIQTAKCVRLLVDVHHSIADGMTLSRLLLNNDIPNAYNDIEAFLSSNSHCANTEEVIPCCCDCINAENASLLHGIKEAQKTLFEGRCCAKLSADVANAWSEEVTVATSVARADIDKWCKEQHTTPNILFLSAFSLVVSRLCRESEIVLFTLYHGRTTQTERNAYGMFVKSLPLLIDATARQSASAYMTTVRKALHRAVRRSAYPAVMFCKDLHISPTMMFAFQSDDVTERAMIDGKAVTARQLPHGESNQDMNCLVYADDSKYEVRLSSAQALNSIEMLEMVAKATVTCAKELIAKQQKPLCEIQIVTPHEAETLLQIGKGKEVKLADNDNIVAKFCRQALKTPHRTAVTDSMRSMTYDILAQRVASLAARLKGLCTAGGQCVCTAMCRDAEILTALLGTMAARCVYVPLDLSTPAARLCEIKADCGATILLTTHSADSDVLSQLHFDTIVYLDELQVDAHPSALQDVRIALTDVAYMMYTSGSTGHPKGVVISHGALANFVSFVASEWHLSVASRICCHSSFAFDASLEDLLPVLTVGGSVFLPDETTRKDLHLLADYLKTNGITGGCYTTSVGLMLTDHYDICAEYLCLGGEALKRKPRFKWRIINTYGPTECTVNATYCDVAAANHSDTIPIGRPFPNMRALVTAPDGTLLPYGATGELCLQGIQMAEGYHNNPVETAQRFYTDRLTGRRTYRTGDLVKWNHERQIEFIGRTDTQIKLNGFRIEPHEVELAMLRHKSISQAVVTLKKTSDSTATQLCAYFTATETLDSSVIREHLQKILPHYMLPSKFIQVAEMPLTANGKTDLRVLPCPQNTAREHVPPRDVTEQTLCNLFADILKTQQAGIDDSFFALGGTSILAMLLCSEAEKHGLHISYDMVYKWETVRKIVENNNVLSSHSRQCSADEHLTDFGNNVYEHRQLAYKGSANTEAKPPKTLLLTGATGFLGCHILHECLSRDYEKIYCIVRAKNNQSAPERLNYCYRRYFGATSYRQYLHKTVVVEGDITDALTFKKLETTDIEMVIHCAASVRYVAQNDEIYRANVTATRNVRNYCMKTGARLTHISTVATGFNTQYAASKREAERLLCNTEDNGDMTHHRKSNYASCIIRIGNLMPRHSDGMFQINVKDNAFCKMLTLLHDIGAVPEKASGWRADISPVDDVAKAVVLLSEDLIHTTAENISGCTIYHATPEEKIELQRLTASLPAVTNGDFLEKARHLSAEAYGMSKLLLSVGDDLWGSTENKETTVLRQQTNSRLAQYGFSWSKRDDRYITKTGLPGAK